jgi:hypothetical protein
VHAEPVVDHDPVEALVSVKDDAVAYSSCTDAPTGADPVNINVCTVVMLSVADSPVSYVESVESRSGTDTAGSTYRTMTMPEPPLPAVPFVEGQ